MWIFFLLALIIVAIAQVALAPQISASVMVVGFMILGVLLAVLYGKRRNEQGRAKGHRG